MQYTPVVRALALILLLSAHGCGASSPEPVTAVEEPAEEVKVPEARLSVERHSGYGDDWDQAYDAILDLRLQAFARLGARRVVLAPHAIGGSITPHVVRTDLHFDDGESRSILVVAHGEVLERRAGPEGFTTYLSSLDFPRAPLPAPLLVQLACYFDGVIEEPEPFCAAIGEEPRAEGRFFPRPPGAVLVLERTHPWEPREDSLGDDDEKADVPSRIVIRFDADAELSVEPMP
jgi:hypothetical protein